MRDHFYDCPDRERVGFWGDGTPELDQCFYLFDSASHQLCKELVLRKLEPRFYPGQHLEFLGRYGLWFYYFLGLGTLSTASLKPLPLRPEKETRLDKKSWTASASVPDGSFLFSGDKIPIDISAANAIDGDHWTGWRDMTKTQYPGQWFQVDMKAARAFDKIVLDTTWALWDSPDKHSVSVSNDGADWGTPLATGSGQLGITTITFPAQTARHIRVTQTGTNATYHWSIYEFDVYKRN